MSAIANGSADIASVDEISFAALARYEPALAAAVRPIGQTRDAPTPSFVSGAATNTATRHHLREALEETFADPSLSNALFSLGLSGRLLPR